MVFALLGQHIELAHGVQHLGRLLHLGDPGIETGLIGRGDGLELHAGEAGAAVAAGDPLVLTRLVGNQMQLGLHPGHGVDLTAQLRNEEGVHHGVGGHPEVDRGIDREGQLIDRGDTQFRIDKQPFPVEGNNIDLDRFDVRFQRFIRIQRVGSFPGNHRQDGDNNDGYGPDNRFNLVGVRPIRGVFGGGIGCSVFTSKGHRHNNHRNHYN
ncbi:hypothetical protein D3C79_531410 [compost metagenome]